MCKHTPGPWRWEVSRDGKRVHLVGGRPQFDKTVMDFRRWGMNSAAPRFNSAVAGGEFNIMYAPHEYNGWIVPFPGRKHHAHWCADIDHPDARLIAAAPDLLAALSDLADLYDTDEGCRELPQYLAARAAIANANASIQAGE